MKIKDYIEKVKNEYMQIEVWTNEDMYIYGSSPIKPTEINEDISECDIYELSTAQMMCCLSDDVGIDSVQNLFFDDEEEAKLLEQAKNKYGYEDGMFCIIVIDR